ncbi:MAG: hypothetical protein R6U96_02775 [Promethearchaeia archaeon]
MVKKRYLSKKKNTRQTITISPFLKDWVKRFVKDQQEKYPNNDNYRSVSSFITYILKENLKLLEHGKTLDDLKNRPDKETLDFFDKITFKAIVQQYEIVSECGKYLIEDFDFLFPLLSKYRIFMMKNKKSEEEFTIKDFLEGSERIYNFMKNNKITRNFSINQMGEKLIVEYSAYYTNIHFILSKTFIMMGSILGFEFLNVSYENNYTRMDIIPTNLFSNPKLLKNKRKELYLKNIKHLVNYHNLLKDEKCHHLWLDMASKPNALISFRSVEDGVKQIKKMIDEISSHCIRKERPEFILDIFKNFGWINRKHEQFSYELLISPEENRIEKEIMKEIYKYIKGVNIIKKVKKNDNLYQFIV